LAVLDVKEAAGEIGGRVEAGPKFTLDGANGFTVTDPGEDLLGADP
jgi:hypothetical protein